MILFKKSIITLALITVSGIMALAQVPDKPTKPSPIIDLAGVINNDSLVAAMNTQLDTLSKRTQNQIVVVTVDDMGGYDPKEFATELGNKWGIGGKRLDNGLVIVIKPKNDNGNGQVGFATGYGLEGAFPDVFCKRLQTDFMLPHFKEGDYAGGIKAAIDEIVPVVMTDYKQSQALAGDNSKQKKSGSGNGWFILAAIIGVIAILMLLSRRKKGTTTNAQPQQAATQPQNQEKEQPKNTQDNNNQNSTAGAAGATAGATLASATKPERANATKKQSTKKEDAPKPYEYGYSGGTFGGGGASSSW